MTSQILTEDDKLMAAGYVLGDLEPNEQQAFEQQLSQNPALVAEVESLRASLRLLPQGLPPLTPPPQLRDQVLAAFALEYPESAAETVAPIQPRRGFSWSWGAALLAGLAALWLGLDNLRLRDNLRFAQQPSGETEAVATLLQRPNTKLVPIKSTGSGSTAAGNAAAGTLLFTPGKWQQVIVSLGNLPPLPPDQVYRMWLTLQNGQTLPCGEFNTNAAGSVFIKINPTQTPPKGVKATGVFVTVDAANAPMQPRGERVMSGSI